MSNAEKNEVQVSGKKSGSFSEVERDAMKARAKELKAEERANKNKAEGETECLAKIAELPEPDRAIAQRLHEIIKANAPVLAAKTWYGMPAYARDGKIVCFYQSAQKFGTRYGTLGFNDSANLDDGEMWPTAYALMEITGEVEAKVTELVKKAVS